MCIDADLYLEENNLKIWVLLVSFVMYNGLPYIFFSVYKVQGCQFGNFTLLFNERVHNLDTTAYNTNSYKKYQQKFSIKFIAYVAISLIDHLYWISGIFGLCCWIVFQYGELQVIWRHKNYPCNIKGNEKNTEISCYCNFAK